MCNELYWDSVIRDCMDRLGQQINQWRFFIIQVITYVACCLVRFGDCTHKCLMFIDCKVVAQAQTYLHYGNGSLVMFIS